MNSFKEFATTLTSVIKLCMVCAARCTQVSAREKSRQVDLLMECESEGLSTAQLNRLKNIADVSSKVKILLQNSVAQVIHLFYQILSYIPSLFMIGLVGLKFLRYGTMYSSLHIC